MFARLVLILSGALFVAFGLWALFAPDSLAALVHFGLNDNVARTEMRAFYGGLEIGFGVFLLISSTNRSNYRTALLSCACILTGIATARIIGFAIDNSAGTTIMLAALGTELIGAACCWYAWKNTRAPKS